MKIVVLSGSPKGLLSGTLHYVFFLQKKFPEHDFPIVHICVDYEKLERDPAAFEEVLEKVRSANGVFWCFPIYTFLVHSHYKRFIELVFARGAQEAFRGKYTAAFSTSIHFFDHTAHNYLQAICEDWGMHWTGGYSAWVYDLLKKPEQERVLQFARDWFAAIRDRTPTARVWDPVQRLAIDYQPVSAPQKAPLNGKKVTILLDSAGDSTNLMRMVGRLRECLDGQVVTVDLSQIRLHSGCDGCFQCGADGHCVFRNADDIHDLYWNKLAPADAIVMAGAVVDRYLSWRWKLFFDRGFHLPLVPWWPGKQLGFVVSGSLRQLPTLRQILEGYAEFHQSNLAGIVTDEQEDSRQTDALLDHLAHRIVAGCQSGYVKPKTFLGVGGTKIFRDEEWGYLRPVFQVGHRYYRTHGMYDFPHKSLKNWLLITGGMLFVNFPGVRKEFFRSVKKGMVAPLQKVLARMK
jgi:multimeric flavodoxin WrbA